MQYFGRSVIDLLRSLILTWSNTLKKLLFIVRSGSNTDMRVGFLELDLW